MKLKLERYVNIYFPVLQGFIMIKMRISKITLVVHIFLLSLSCYGQNWDWAHSFSTNALDMVFCEDICTDNTGNVYITGTCYSGTMTVAGNQAPYTVGGICFIAKFDSNGSLLLLKVIHNADGLKIDVDENQNIYVYGSVNVLFSFAGSTYFYDKFIVKYDMNGNEIWAISADNIWINDIIVSPQNKLGFIATYHNTVAIDTFQFTSEGNSDILVGEINTDGSYSWIQSFGNQNYDQALAISYDNFSNIIIGGGFSDTLELGGFSIHSVTYPYNIYITKISPGGNIVVSVNTFPVELGITDLCVNSSNETILLLVGGGSNYLLDGISITNPLPVPQGNDILCKMDTSGSIVWAKNIYGYQPIFRIHIDVNSLDEVVLTGTHVNNNNGLPLHFFVGDTMINYNYPNNYSDYPFILRFRDDGVFQMGEVVHVSGGQNETYGICVDNNDDVYITGFFAADTMYFGSDTTLTKAMNVDFGFIAKYDDCSFQDIKLKQGWSLVSSYIDPSNNSMVDIFAPVDTSVQIIKSDDGLVYWPQFNLNLIGGWQYTEGYQIYMNETRWIRIYGNQLIPEQTQVPVQTGWQFISYLRYNPWPVDSVFNQNSMDVSLMKNGNGEVYWPQWNVNAIGTMKPGEGYQLKAINPFDLYYPANG
ncbi:MAG: hypothetical protein U9R19_05195 [Bacteroidota bacterium]|nr:hypothetical protein [Bacteroidota bacterium]